DVLGARLHGALDLGQRGDAVAGHVPSSSYQLPSEPGATGTGDGSPALAPTTVATARRSSNVWTAPCTLCTRAEGIGATAWIRSSRRRRSGTNTVVAVAAN